MQCPKLMMLNDNKIDMVEKFIANGLLDERQISYANSMRKFEALRFMSDESTVTKQNSKQPIMPKEIKNIQDKGESAVQKMQDSYVKNMAKMEQDIMRYKALMDDIKKNKKTNQELDEILLKEKNMIRDINLIYNSN